MLRHAVRLETNVKITPAALGSIAPLRVLAPFDRVKKAPANRAAEAQAKKYVSLALLFDRLAKQLCVCVRPERARVSLANQWIGDSSAP